MQLKQHYDHGSLNVTNKQFARNPFQQFQAYNQVMRSNSQIGDHRKPQLSQRYSNNTVSPTVHHSNLGRYSMQK